MLIGIKLENGFSEDALYRQLYGDRNIPAYLRKLGFSAVETPVGLETQGEKLKEQVVCCCSNGLKVSFHCYSESTTSNPAFFSLEEKNLCLKFHKRVFSLAAEVSYLQQFPTVVTIHPAVGKSSDLRHDIVNRSVIFFSWAHDWCCQNAPDVRIVAELQISPNLDESIQRIGDTYEELLEIVDRSGVKACWDFGHAYMNAKRYGVQLYPTDELLHHVRHVHCHDANCEDHNPLIFNSVPWKCFVQLLVNSGFDETIILEVPPSQFLNAGGLESLVFSFNALNDWIDQCKNRNEH